MKRDLRIMLHNMTLQQNIPIVSGMIHMLQCPPLKNRGEVLTDISVAWKAGKMSHRSTSACGECHHREAYVDGCHCWAFRDLHIPSLPYASMAEPSGEERLSHPTFPESVQSPGIPTGPQLWQGRHP